MFTKIISKNKNNFHFSIHLLGINQTFEIPISDRHLQNVLIF